MTRRPIIVLCATYTAVMVLVLLCAATVLTPPSCSTPAANFATLTSCRTATAAGAATPTATRTAGAVASPTRLAPQRLYCRAGSVTVTPVAPGRELVVCEEWTP